MDVPIFINGQVESSTQIKEYLGAGRTILQLHRTRRAVDESNIG